MPEKSTQTKPACEAATKNKWHSAQSHCRYVLVGACLLLTATSSHAAIITWSAKQQITSALDVSTNGTLVGVVNLDGPLASVNGVSFQALDINSGPATIGNFSVNGFFFNQFNPGFDSWHCGTVHRSQCGLPVHARHRRRGRWHDDPDLRATVGQDYEFQAWVNDSRNQVPPGFTFGVEIAAGNSVELDPNPSLNEGGLGQFVIGAFTADNASQQVTFTNGEVGVINGFQLRQIDATTAPVPEPNTLATWGVIIGLVGLVAARHRKQPA